MDTVMTWAGAILVPLILYFVVPSSQGLSGRAVDGALSGAGNLLKRTENSDERYFYPVNGHPGFNEVNHAIQRGGAGAPRVPSCVTKSPK